MKYKLFALIAASLTMAAYGQQTKEAPPTGDTPKGDPIATSKTAKKIAASKVATSIAPVLKKLDGKKYVPTKLKGNPDYYIMYFTASW